MNGLDSAMAWQKQGAPSAQSKAKDCQRNDFSERNARREMNSLTPGTGEDALLSITEVRSDFFARNVRLRS